MAAQRVRTVVVTGGSAGVGRAVATAFGRRGWNVGVIARGEAGVEATVKEIRAAGGEALGVIADVADAEAMVDAARIFVLAFDEIDVWINNAMATVYAPVQEMTPAEFARVTAVTYLGQVHGTLAALEQMRRQDRGTVVLVGSALAYRSIPLQSAYCAAKAAVRGFADSLRSELLHDGSRVRLTMVQLPAVDTPQFDWARSRLPRRPQPVPPIFAPEAVAARIVEAALAAPRELWIGTPAWKAILGTMAAPGLVDRYLARHGYDGEMSDEPARPDRPDNLDAPVDRERDHGARGRFGDRAIGRVVAADPRSLRAGLAGAGLALVAGAAWLASRRRDRPS
ncbi:SDR family oxidoreductase [uncultured Methylobacterium sp.]|jgi:NAD(P)-dependent dehydrogenase (short-subunit alcohol dehydrogenase family)|uniref:SDR family oxidoreductase n=1 Tax=uncultured Methylobacterium sp. TaxID=157278 RepID=UPI00263703FB|nr:SDR family oxidoreductase [uncultured Methylobacterium sp.]